LDGREGNEVVTEVEFEKLDGREADKVGGLELGAA